MNSCHSRFVTRYRHQVGLLQCSSYHNIILGIQYKETRAINTVNFALREYRRRALNSGTTAAGRRSEGLKVISETCALHVSVITQDYQLHRVLVRLECRQVTSSRLSIPVIFDIPCSTARYRPRIRGNLHVIHTYIHLFVSDTRPIVS